jgi:large subunit ribosomal protein L15
MDLSSLKYAEGSRKTSKRKGRGVGSGNGKTAGRGHNGYYSRGGSKHRVAFEGGQMPIQRRLPKYGFTNVNSKDYIVVNVNRLNNLEAGTEVTPEVLYANGIIAKKNVLVKILGNGELNVKLSSVSAHKFSKTAVEQIEKLGGKVVEL